jgi:rhodanese-related sulfurtransferase
MTNTIRRDDVKAALDRHEPVTLVEALPEKYYRDGHLPGAINIPHDQVDALAPRLLPDKVRRIVTYCANAPCQNSRVAAERLIALGYTNVFEYVEGKQDWTEAGLSLEKSQ